MTNDEIDALIFPVLAQTLSGTANQHRAIVRAALHEAARIADKANEEAGYSLPFIAGDAIRAATGYKT